MSIPRRIVQTHRSESIHPEWRQTWRDHHPGYEYLFFEDAQCRAFLAERLPMVLPTYDRLPLAVQKADLFRYAAIYELGGTYCDVDTLCCAPLESYIDLSQEQLVCGLEMTPAQYGGEPQQYAHQYCAPYQLLQWTFSASPRHPALAVLMDRIRYLVAGMTPELLARYSRVSRFTLELTGPMVFTHVLNEFLSGTRAGKVTVLPRLAWGAWPAETGREEVARQVKVRHLFEGSWKTDQAPKKVPEVIGKVNFRIQI
ncbi:MAG: glycosyltransferase [Polaromonas sp.]|nr:glycosyltransferase [Polaromonas sp.]